jgi:tRNA-splicing ligase RtcB
METKMRIIDGIPVFGTEVDGGALAQIKNCARTADYVALMADHHKGYAVPIGGVVAYRNAVSPSGVGYDIGCGNKAVRLDCDVRDVIANISTIMNDVFANISFGIGRKNAEQVDHALFEDQTWKMPAISGLKDLARQQLGTVGSGNHYVDIFVDELARVWIGVHFGSRGFGHKVATYFLKQAGAVDGMDADPCVLKLNRASGSLGEDYLEAMRLAGLYAYAGRDWVCERVAKMLGGKIVEEIHNHHNYAWHEEHNGEMLYVVRKGATPAFPGQKGCIGSSMATSSVIVEGVEDESNKFTLNSTVHGAGRVMGRTEAIGKIDRKTGLVKRVGRVTQAMMDHWVNGAVVELRGGGLDESPDCYKRLSEVLNAQGNGIKVLHTLKPIGVAMAGKDIFDPYKD